jgi:hypothetical protein
MATTFASELRQGFDQVAGSLPAEALVLVARARDTVGAGPAERDRLLAEIVTAYRAGPRHLWAPVILDLLGPGLLEVLEWIDDESQEIADVWDDDDPPIVQNEEEIRQQLVMEVLNAAATIPIHRGGRAMKRRILMRAYKYVVRWLGREGRHHEWHRSLEALEERVELKEEE